MAFKALVIEDSIIFQQVMGEVLKGLDEIESVEIANSGRPGLDLISRKNYDVLFLDMNLPDINGLEILAELRKFPNRPSVIVVSSAGGHGTDMTVKALQAGALEFICKPAGAGFNESVEKLRADLKQALRTVRHRRPAGLSAARPATTPVAPAPTSFRTSLPPRGGFWLTAIAVSTGGPESLAKVIPALPANYPTPIVLVQHMPPLFTASLATSLNNKSKVTVVEAEEGMELKKGHVYIAPGGRHMTIKREGGRSIVRLNDNEAECHVRPAADVLFRSISRIPESSSVLAVVMTGMGEDGKVGVECLKQGKCHCLSQTEDTCVVYGMPRAMDENGLSDERVPLNKIAARMTELNIMAMTPAR
jgi:two-component system chemotaxis response regulator CheB